MQLQSCIQSRIFMVGCPRSGTTLLQSVVAAHPQIISFPESKFFRELAWIGTRRSKLGLASRNSRATFNQFLQDIGQDEMRQFLPRASIFIHQHAKAFIKVLDTVAQQQGRSCWLEKTPSHIQCINRIEQLVERAKFIHVVRNGADVIASLYEVTHKYPEVWTGARSIDQCIQRWMNDIQITRCHLHKPNHLLVRYERFVENPQLVSEEIFKFIGLPFDAAILQERAAISKQLVRGRERWKEAVGGEIKSQKHSKFYQVFEEEQRRYILDKVSEIDLDQLEIDPETNLPEREKTDCFVP